MSLLEHPRTQRSTRIHEMPYWTELSLDLIERWADGIPRFSENNPSDPEWRATPVYELDLGAEGYGRIFLKDESDPQSNPTRTIKDRKAWEFATLYRDFAQSLWVDLKRGYKRIDQIQRMSIPRLSLITAGNEGKAVAACFERYGLPPPKLVMGSHSAKRFLQAGSLHADVYAADLFNKPLTADDIRALSENENGIDITSLVSIDPHATYYDWHVHEVLNMQPDEVYLPYGVGHLRDNYLTWQRRTAIGAMRGVRDPRLKVDPVEISHMNVFAAEPETIDSVADKLACKFKPYRFLKENDVDAARQFNVTGTETEKLSIGDDRILEAFDILKKRGIASEPSAAAGLALYLERHEQGLVKDDAKVVVVNTGTGI